MVLGTRVEKNFAQQAVVLAEYALGNLQVPLERGARRVLVLHDGGEHKGGHERDTQGVGHRLIVFVERVFAHVQAEPAVEVAEEDAPHVVALVDDDGVLVAQAAQVGEGGAEHRVRAHVAHSRGFVEFLEAGLHRRDVAQDAVLRQQGNHLPEHVQRVFQRDGVDDQFGTEGLDFVRRGEPLRVVHEAQPFGVDVVHRRLMVEAEQVHEERAHLSCT